MLRTAVITNHSLGISRWLQIKLLTLWVSAYLYQDGIMDVDNNYKRLNFRAAVDYNATNWLKVGFNGVFSQSEQQVPNNAAGQKAFNCSSYRSSVFDKKQRQGLP